MTMLTTPQPANGVAWLLCGHLHEDEPVRNIRVDSSPFVIGRRDDASLTIPCPTVSGQHAEMIVHDNQLFVRDLESRNGTYVNGERIEGSFRLGAGDLVQFARAIFRIVAGTGSKVTCTVNNEDAADRALALIQFDKLVTDREVSPHYQPIVTIDAGETIGYEILGRSRLFGLTTPDAMFGAAAVLDLEAELSRILRYEGVRGAAMPGDGILFANTHPIEMADIELLEFSLREILPVAGDRKIVLEIHEKSVTCVSQMRELRSALKELGIGLAYDDFGAGQARLLELVEVPPDYLKFDIGLIRDIDQAPANRQKMLAALVEMVRELNVLALAEGVETEGELETCRQLGFDLIQGFVVGRPQRAEAFQDGSSQS